MSSPQMIIQTPKPVNCKKTKKKRLTGDRDTPPKNQPDTKRRVGVVDGPNDKPIVSVTIINRTDHESKGHDCIVIQDEEESVPRCILKNDSSETIQCRAEEILTPYYVFKNNKAKPVLDAGRID
jgi:hypothetical protein